MLTYLNKVNDHVFTKQALVTILDGFINTNKGKIDQHQLNNLQKVKDAVVQVYDRIDQLKQTVVNLQKVNNIYMAKIASYAADQAQRMKQATAEKEDVNPALSAEQNLEATMYH